LTFILVNKRILIYCHQTVLSASIYLRFDTIIITYLLIKVYKIHKSNKTSKTEQDSKAH